MEIGVIYSDENIIVINKPPGISVHGGPTVIGRTVVDFLLEQFSEVAVVGDMPSLRPGIIHRLDKDTSGVMVVARTQESFLKLKQLFQTREVEKMYWAVVCGNPKNTHGTISAPIGRIAKNPFKRGIDIGKGRIRGAREAITEYKVLKPGEKFSLLEVQPKTGRTHQIRVHLSSIHHPVACDQIYGGKDVCCPTGGGRQLLHARSLAFGFEGKKYRFEADPPQDFKLAIQNFL